MRMFIFRLLVLFPAGWGSLKRGLPEKQFEIVVDLKFVNGWLLISPCGGADFPKHFGRLLTP